MRDIIERGRNADLAETIRRLHALRDIYVDEAAKVSESEVQSVTRLIAGHIATQRTGPLSEIAVALGPLIQAADAFGPESHGGRWRALAEVVTYFSSHPQELEVARWLDTSSVKGRILRRTYQSPGLTPEQLAEALMQTLTQLSSDLAYLEQTGFIRRVLQGGEHKLYLSRPAHFDVNAACEIQSELL